MFKRALSNMLLLVFICAPVLAQEPTVGPPTFRKHMVKSANVDISGNLYIETFSIPHFLITDVRNVTTTIDEKLDGTYVWVEFSTSADGTRHYADNYGKKGRVPLANKAIIFVSNLGTKTRWDAAIDAALQNQGRRGSDVFPTVDR